MIKGKQKEVYGLFMLAMTILILGVSSGCKDRTAEKKPLPLATEFKESIYGYPFFLIATRYNIPKQAVKDILLENGTLYRTGYSHTGIVEIESKIEGYSKKYQIPKEKIASVLWDWMMYREAGSSGGEE